MSRIIIPTDFSEGSLVAAAFALDAFGAEGNEFILLHAFVVAADPMALDIVTAFQVSAESGLELFEERVHQLPGASHAMWIRHARIGSVIDAIEDLHASDPAIAVVMGAHGAGSSVLWGSTTSSVVKACGLPVFVIPGDWTARPFREILYADDQHGPASAQALDLLRLMAMRYGAEVVRVRVHGLDERIAPIQDQDSDPEWLGATRHHDLHVHDDEVAGHLLDLMLTGRFGMAAALHRRRTWLEAIFHKSVAKHLALHASVPLLVLQD